MPVKIDVNKELGALEICMAGDASVFEWKGILRRSLDIYSRQGIAKVLIDARKLARPPNAIELFEFTRMLPGVMQFAIFISNWSDKDILFLETVAYNRGLNVKVFHKRNDGIEWLGLV